jgi:hypothetical protein
MDEFSTILKTLLEPFQADRASLSPGPDLVKKAVAAFEGVDDFTATGAAVLKSEILEKLAGFLGPLFDAGDRIGKKGRTLAVDPSGPRRIQPPGLPWPLHVKGAFTLEFAPADEPLSDPGAQDRLGQALPSLFNLLGRKEPGGILIAAVLPQKKKMLGIETPLAVEILGLPFYLRFLMATFSHGRSRIFVVGPVIREIKL